MYCFQASEPDSRPPPVAFSPKITRKPLKISKIAKKKPLNFHSPPNAPPISAPEVGMLTFTMPQSEPRGPIH